MKRGLIVQSFWYFHSVKREQKRLYNVKNVPFPRPRIPSKPPSERLSFLSLHSFYLKKGAVLLRSHVETFCRRRRHFVEVVNSLFCVCIYAQREEINEEIFQTNRFKNPSKDHTKSAQIEFTRNFRSAMMFLLSDVILLMGEAFMCVISRIILSFSLSRAFSLSIRTLLFPAARCRRRRHNSLL